MARHGAHRCFQHVAPQQFSVEAVEPVARRSLGFAVERALQLLDFRGRSYPVEPCFHCRPAIIRSLAVPAHLDPIAPPSLPGGFTLRQIIPTTRDSDSSSDPRQLGGVPKSEAQLSGCAKERAPPACGFRRRAENSVSQNLSREKVRNSVRRLSNASVVAR